MKTDDVLENILARIEEIEEALEGCRLCNGEFDVFMCNRCSLLAREAIEISRKLPK